MRQTFIPYGLVATLNYLFTNNVDGFGRASVALLGRIPSQQTSPSILQVTLQQPSPSKKDNELPTSEPLPSLHDSSTRTALSMTIEELSEALGGRGRARLAWDCYSEGADPSYLFSSTSDDSNSIDIPNKNIAPSLFDWNEYQNKESLKKKVLPTPRQTQPLGNSALQLLSKLHAHCNGTIENGLATLVHVSTSSDGTTKLLLRLIDGWEVETVLIPFWADGNHKQQNNSDEARKEGNNSKQKDEGQTIGRTTVCISSQVGCRQGCTFCATGKMGKLRSLTTDEILAQLFFAKKIVRLSQDGILVPPNNQASDGGGITLPKISNVVFMGMGEPSDNSASVRSAINIMTQNDYFQLSATRVTVSTVAPTPEAFSDFVDSRCVLAWSVHAVRDELRRQLVPTTKYTMEQLRDGLIDALKRRSLRTVMIEVALMDGVNDSLREANELAEFVSHITREVPGSKLICNLIPFNDIGGAGGIAYRKPSMERVTSFQKRLQALGIYAHVRGTRGGDESAACGQLVTSRKKKELETAI